MNCNYRKTIVLTLALLACGLTFQLADAGTIPIANPSFENLSGLTNYGNGFGSHDSSPDWFAPPAGSNNLNGWAVPTSPFDVNSYTAHSGSYSFNLDDAGPLVQSIGSPTANTKYALAFWARNNTNSTGSREFVAEILDGTQLIASTGPIETHPLSTWTPFTLNAITGTTVSDDLTIRFRNLSWQFTGWLDDVSLTSSPVPEPSTFALLGMGTVGLLGWAWRRRT